MNDTAINKKGATATGKSKIWSMSLVAVFAALIVICSWISIPFAIPFTLQTFAVFCTLGVVGSKRGLFSILVYILLGAVGVPVFAGFTGGLGILAGATGGYIIGFIFMPPVYMLIIKLFGNKIWSMAVGMALGLAVCYAFGTVWYSYLTAAPFVAALGYCVVPFIAIDIVKMVLSIFISRRVGKYVKTLD